MNKYSLGPILFCFFLLLKFNVDAATIEKTYFFSTPEIIQSGDYAEISFPGTTLFGEPGKPVLPFYPVTLLLPKGEIASQISIEFIDPIEIEGTYRIKPQQNYRPLSYMGMPEFVQDEIVYASHEAYPADQTPSLRTDFISGHGFALSHFTPLRYVPAEGKVIYFQRVNVTISTAPGAKALQAVKNLNSSRMTLENIMALAQNPEMIEDYSGASNPLRTESYDYLMITSDAFVTELDTLMDFYLDRGITSRCYSLSNIDTTSTGLDMPEKMRNFIIDEFQDHSISYVLLAGDVEVVPYRGFYCYVQSGGGYSDSNIPSDLYFSALDGNWNDDGDNLWGEPGEDDLLPEVAVGRLTFSDTAELHNMLHKVMMYQQDPVVEDLNQPLLVGEHLYNDPETWGSDYMRLLVGHQTYNGYVTDGIPPDDDIDTLYDRYSSWTKYRLMDSINNGHSFVHHVGHANSNYVMKFVGSDITNANFSQVNGVTHQYPVIYTHGCICGAFDNSDCIGERMIGIDNFAVAFVGNSRYGWFVEGTCDGPSEHLHREFVDALYSDSLYRIGMAHMKSKLETAPFVDLAGEYEPGAHRWCFYDCNVLGDPMMAMWTDFPHEVEVDHPPLMMIGADSLVIEISYNGIPQKGMICGLFQSDSLLGSAETGADGFGNIPLNGSAVEGECVLVVSGYNVLPQYCSISAANYWLGITSDWDDPENWFLGAVPDDNAEIIIPANPAGNQFPVLNSGRTCYCRTLFLEPGATVHLGENDILIIQGN